MAKELRDTCPSARDILDGKLDVHLHHIERAINERRLAQAEAMGLRAGAYVTYTDTCPEPHLRGATQRVQSIGKTGKTIVTADCSIMLGWFTRGYVRVKR